MGVKLEWQFGEHEDDVLDASLPAMQARPGPVPGKARGVYERNPALLRLRLRSRFSYREYPENIYVFSFVFVLVFLWAMYVFV